MKFTLTFSIYIILFLSCVVADTSSDSNEDEDVEEDANDIQSRILGGKPAQNYPHIVSLQDSASKKHYCAGSIISPTWILTSALCKANNVEAVAGTKNLKAKNKQIQRRTVELFIGHEDFDRTVKQSAFDIALAKVSTPFLFDRRGLVSSIDLPRPSTYNKPTVAYVAGWGKYLTKKENESQNLKHAKVSTFSSTSCLIWWVGTNFTDTNMCAGSMNGDGSACKSDSGGPLMVQWSTRPLRYTLIGIVSWGITDCGQPGKPSIYTSVSSYIDWIAMKIEENTG